MKCNNSRARVNPLLSGLYKLAIDSSTSNSSGDESSNGSYARPKPKRKVLGVFSDTILKRKLARGEPIFGQPITMDDDTKKCGIYKEGTIVQGAKIVSYKDSHNFYFYQAILTDEERDIMLAAPTFIYERSKQQIHASNPYHADINQLKLYFDGTAMHRCQIKDLYCECIGGGLELVVVIHLYDEPKRIEHVRYSSIYDYPQRIRYLQEVEPEVKPARLYLGGEIPEGFKDADVEAYIKKLVVGANRHEFYNIKILDFKDDVYYVDLISPKSEHKSLVGLILQKFGETKYKRFLGCDTPDWSEPQPFQSFCIVRQLIPPRVSSNRMIKARDECASHGGVKFGSLAYFKSQIKPIDKTDFRTSYTSKRFFKALVIDWKDPDHITLQPPGYRGEALAQFLEALNSLKCVREADEVYLNSDKPYKIGEHVIYKNVTIDQELGKWLRGVVVGVSYYNEYTFAIDNKLSNARDNDQMLLELIEKKLIDPIDLIYMIRSVDFGFYNKSSQDNMRHLQDLRQVKTVGTWGLRCRLFGISLLPGDWPKDWKVPARHSSSCAEFVDGWMRERIHRNGVMSTYNVLFRTDISKIKPWEAYDRLIDISLFHRFKPEQDLPLMGPCRTPFNCLNWFLVERGLARDSRRDKPDEDVSSHIQLEDYVVNLLVKRDML